MGNKTNNNLINTQSWLHQWNIKETTTGPPKDPNIWPSHAPPSKRLSGIRSQLTPKVASGILEDTSRLSLALPSMNRATNSTAESRLSTASETPPSAPGSASVITNTLACSREATQASS